MATRSMLLGRNRRFRRLWLARVVSFLGDSMGLVALILYVAAEVGSGTVALLLLAGDFTPMLLSPFVGAIADRLDRRRLLVTCEALGPLLAAALLPFMSPLGLLSIDALTFLASPLLLAGVPRMPSAVSPGGSETVAAAARSGVRYIWRHQILRPVAVAFLVVVAFNGVDDVALVFLGRETFAAGNSGVSLLYAGSGVGLLLGFALLVSRVARFPPVTIAVAGFAIGSAGNLLTGLSPVIAAAFAMQLVRGVGISLMEVGPTTLLQRTVPREFLGRAFANLYGAIGLATGCSYLVGGPLLDRLSPRTVLVIAGTGGIAASAVLAVRVRTSAGRGRG